MQSQEDGFDEYSANETMQVPEEDLHTGKGGKGETKGRKKHVATAEVDDSAKPLKRKVRFLSATSPSVTFTVATQKAQSKVRGNKRATPTSRLAKKPIQEDDEESHDEAEASRS